MCVAEVAFTFCRTCRGFEAKFRKLADKHSDVPIYSLQSSFKSEPFQKEFILAQKWHILGRGARNVQCDVD